MHLLKSYADREYESSYQEKNLADYRRRCGGDHGVGDGGTVGVWILGFIEWKFILR